MHRIRRLLVIGTSVPNRLDSFYIEGFRTRGVDVTIFDEDRQLRRWSTNRVLNRLTLPVQHLVFGRALLDFYRQPRWDAVLVFKGYMLAPEVLRACRRRAEVPWAVFNPDSPFEHGSGVSSRHIRGSISEYDLHFMWSRRLLPRLREAGAKRAVYLPFAHDSASHFPPETLDPALRQQVSFIGSFDRQRAAALESVADMPIRIYGMGWEGLSLRSELRSKVSRGAFFGAELRSLVGSSLACLNILRLQNVGSHNMRTFEVPAMGGVMVTTRSQEQNDFYPEGDASLMFSDSAELRAAIGALLSGQVDVKALRQQALGRSQGHTYLARATEVLSTLNDL